MFNGVKQCEIHPREAGQHHGITPVARPFVLVDGPCLSWIGHHRSKTQLLQKAAHPRTVRASFHHRSGAGITSCHTCELFARIAQTSLSGHLSGFVQHALCVTTVTEVQSDRDLRFILSGCVIHKASSLPTRSMARRPPLPSHLIWLRSERRGAPGRGDNFRLDCGVGLGAYPATGRSRDGLSDAA